MSYEDSVLLEQATQDDISNNIMIGGLVAVILLGLLYVSGIVHASVRLGYEKIEANNLTRTIMLLVAIFMFPMYWIVYPIVYLSGGIKTA